MWPNPQFPAHLVTFTEEILDRRLHFLCSVIGLLKAFENWFHYFSHVDLLFSFVKTGKVFHKLRLEIFWFNKVADFLNQHFLSGQIDTKKKTETGTIFFLCMATCLVAIIVVNHFLDENCLFYTKNDLLINGLENGLFAFFLSVWFLRNLKELSGCFMNSFSEHWYHFRW